VMVMFYACAGRLDHRPTVAAVVESSTIVGCSDGAPASTGKCLTDRRLDTERDGSDAPARMRGVRKIARQVGSGMPRLRPWVKTPSCT
jgi:hypothetical protein